MPDDRCQLTGATGRFVDCHLIPKAFMRRVQKLPAYEIDGEQRPKRRFSHGWSDKRLVTREGEDVLSLYDDEAVVDLSPLTYSSRRKLVGFDLENLGYSQGNIIRIKIRNKNRLRLFGLSLLWRCAASQRPEMDSVVMRPKRLEEVRQMVVTGDPGLPQVFPMYCGVFDSVQELVRISPMLHRRLSMIRFFLDGIVFYISYKKINARMSALGSFLLGSTEDAAVLVYGSNDSWHLSTSEKILSETSAEYNMRNLLGCC